MVNGNDDDDGNQEQTQADSEAIIRNKHCNIEPISWVQFAQTRLLFQVPTAQRTERDEF